jgi:glycosyltransferase involved in cell wall biosynthesis
MNWSCAPGMTQSGIAPVDDPPTGLIPLLARSSRRGTEGEASPSIAQRPLTPLDPMYARSLVGLVDLLTIVAIGPFDDPAHAQQLAAAFNTVQQQCKAQLVLLGEGAQRAVVIRETSKRAAGTNVHVVSGSCQDQWSEVVAAADVAVLCSSSGITTLVNVLAAGRPVVAPDDPATVELVVPAIAGLVYRPGDVSGMVKALLRLLTTPVLRRGMGGRARLVARRHLIETRMRHRSDGGKGDSRP